MNKANTSTLAFVVASLGLLASASEQGAMTRVGAVARYSIVPLGDEESFATGDLWVEAGAGYEHINWRRGGVLDRPDMALGFG